MGHFAKISILLVSTSLLACAPVPYQEAVGWAKGGRDGYLDRKLAPGVYIIEVQQIGGYQQLIEHEGTIETYKGYWHRRASELCPSGYVGEPQVILPYQAKIEAFQCDLNLCQNYPMISGIARCSANAET